MQMSLADRKLHAIELITRLENEDLLLLVEQLLIQANKEGDWAHDLSEKEKTDIEEGLADLDAGRKLSYEEFQETIKKRFQ